MEETFNIDFEPLGRRGKARSGHTILAAAQDAGVGLASVCGGAGTCEECRVRLAAGKLSPPTLVEQAALSEADLSAGFRLACQAQPVSDIKLDIPPESLTSAQRLQVEGLEETHVLPDPVIRVPGAYGLAVDIGTTKLAAYLIELESGLVKEKSGMMNPQIAFGEDVISRIAFAGSEPGGARKLQEVLVDSLNKMLAEMCAEAGISSESVMDAVLVGNTAMHHLFAGLPVEQLGRSPFSPAITSAMSIPAVDLGLELGAGANIYLPPLIAGYVGADHIAMLLATEACNSPHRVIAMDIGTNTEISLIADGKITSCSCASGPAFEGAHIREGMRAGPGAIERARWSNGKILWQSIENLPPVGICGSGILDLVAALQDGGRIKPTGVLVNGTEAKVVVVPAVQTGLNRDLVITRADIHEIQLAKSAIRVGVEILLKNAGLKFTDIDEFIVAGAFGTYLDLRSAVRIGMFPPLRLDQFHQVGNAAGVGAKQMLVSIKKRQEAESLAIQIEYLELTSQPEFAPLYMKNLCFEI